MLKKEWTVRWTPNSRLFLPPSLTHTALTITKTLRMSLRACHLSPTSPICAARSPWSSWGPLMSTQSRGPSQPKPSPFSPPPNPCP